MFKNLRYVFTFDPAGVRKSLFWECLHGLFIATPSAILLLVIWELFKDQPDIQQIWIWIGIMSFMLVLQFFVANKSMMASNITTFEIGRRLRLELGNKLQRLSLGYYKSKDPGDLASVLLQDAANFENIFGHSFPNMANAIFGVLLLSGFLLYLDWRLAITLLFAIVLVVPLMQWSRWLIVRRGETQVQARTRTTSRFLEYILGIQHIKAYRRTGPKFASLQTALGDLRDASIKVEAIPGPVVLMVGVVLELFFILMIWFALFYLLDGSITVPVLIAFLIIGYRLYEPVKVLMIEYPVLNYMNISLQRIRTILDAPEQPAGQELVPSTFDIEFANVHFSYNEEKKVLQGVSFQAKNGTMTALVGPSGSGKTTITALIARFWDAQEGRISIGGVDVKDMRPQQVYQLISEVFQEVYLFDGTIYDNIKIGRPDASPAEIQKVAELAQVPEFSDQLANGLHSNVGEGGSKLSGGQKQRISIARALLKDAPIVLLDEATASLDPENEIYIQRAIQELVRNKTVIVIAHKLSTVQRANRILVLNEGRLVESGKHEELLAMESGLYAHLWNTQQQVHGWKLSSNPKEAL
ncbi:MAG: ABC transporter ATP-binding protein [Bacteroidota bacterium]